MYIICASRRLSIPLSSYYRPLHPWPVLRQRCYINTARSQQEESEQSLQMYRTAARLFQGSHLPLLFMGMEYLKTNNRNLAANFLAASRKLCSHDPLVHNELGVMAYREGLYDDAMDHFLNVLSLHRLARQRSFKTGTKEGDGIHDHSGDVRTYLSDCTECDEPTSGDSCERRATLEAVAGKVFSGKNLGLS